MFRAYTNPRHEVLELSWDNSGKFLSLRVRTDTTTTSIEISEGTLKDIGGFITKCLNKDQEDREDQLRSSREQDMIDHPEKYDTPVDGWSIRRKKTYGQ